MSTKPRFTVTVHDGDKVVQLVAAESLRCRTNPNGDFVLVVPKPRDVPKPVVPAVSEPSLGSKWVAIEPSGENIGGPEAVYLVVGSGVDRVAFEVYTGDLTGCMVMTKAGARLVHHVPRHTWHRYFKPAPAPEVLVPFLSRWRHYINNHYVVVVVGGSVGPDQVYYKQESGDGTLIGEMVKMTSAGFTDLFRRLPDTKPQQWPQVGSEWHTSLMKRVYRVVSVDRTADIIGVCRPGEPGLVSFVTLAQFEGRFRAFVEAPAEPDQPVPGSKWTYPDGSGVLQVVEKPRGSQREGLVWYRGLAGADRLACGMTQTNFLKNFVPAPAVPLYSEWFNDLTSTRVRIVDVTDDTATYCRVSDLDASLRNIAYTAPRFALPLSEFLTRFRRS